MENSPLDALSSEMWLHSPSLDSVIVKTSPMSTAGTGTTTTTATDTTGSSFDAYCQGAVAHSGQLHDGSGDAGRAGSGAATAAAAAAAAQQQLPGDTASLNNMLSENALESIRRQRSQNKLIHLDPIPDFQDRNQIKPWLQKIFYPQGIEIVIERSDNIKVVFKCKASKRGKQARKQGMQLKEEPDSPSLGKRSNQQKKKRSVSPYNTCPFRVRATYSLKRKKWNIVVVNNGHSHPLKFNADSEDYKKFKNKLRGDNDWEAVRKFDELEYRTRFNLPTEPEPIPCDCGLTQEIESFNIVLPSSNTLANSTDKTVTKPRHRSESSRENKSITNKVLSRSSTPQELQSVSYSSPTQSMHQTILQRYAPASPTTHIQTVQSAPQHEIPSTFQPWVTSTVLPQADEVDFTDLFLKPMTHFKRESSNLAPHPDETHVTPDQWGSTQDFMDNLNFVPPPMCEINQTDDCANVQGQCQRWEHNHLHQAGIPQAQQLHPHPHSPMVPTRLHQQDSTASPIGTMLTSELNNMRIIDGQLHVINSNSNSNSGPNPNATSHPFDAPYSPHWEPQNDFFQ